MNEHNTLLTRQKGLLQRNPAGQISWQKRHCQLPQLHTWKLKKKKNLNLKVKRAISSYTQESHYKGHFLCVLRLELFQYLKLTVPLFRRVKNHSQQAIVSFQTFNWCQIYLKLAITNQNTAAILYLYTYPLWTGNPP